jgi:PRD1 phage membrane DNA delivery
MGQQTISGLVTVVAALVGLGVIATVVSKNADTANIIGTAGRSLSGALTAAEGPVLGSSFGGLNVAGTSSSAGYMN